MKNRINIASLWFAALCGLCGCDLPICDKGDMICGNRASNGIDIVIAQHNQFSSNGDINPQPCQIYNCVDDDFVELKTCEMGSRYEDGVLSCVPRCAENEIVCAIIDENSETGEMSIIGPEQYVPYTDPETREHYSVNDKECELYRCVNDRYVSAGTCSRGSIMSEQGVVSCISKCWNRPKLRCQEDENGVGRVQRCDENHSSGWVDLLCDNSCKFTERGKASGTVYKESGFEAGECGECRNDMDVYCDVTKTKAYKCLNGVITETGGCPTTHTERCGDKYVDLATDRTNCGGCYMHCGETESCTGGKCVEDGCSTTGYMRYPLDGEKIRAYCISDEEKLINVYNNLRQGKSYPAADDDDPNVRNAYVFTNSVSFSGDWKPVSWDNKDLGITIIGHGNTLKIENLITNETEDDSIIAYSGVFGKLNNARIVDLNVLASVEHHHAQLSKSASSLTSEEATNLSMGIEQGAGGVVGFLKNSTVRNVTFKGSVTGTKNVGGIAGIAEGNSKLIDVSTSSGSIIADPYVGFDEMLSPTESLILTPEAEKCLIANDRYKSEIKEALWHQANLGGLVGYLYNSSITNGYSDATVQSADNIPITNAGGLVGYMNGASDLISCHRNKGLDIAGSNIGGLVGSVNAPTLWTEPVIKDSYFASFDKGGIFSEKAATLSIHANLPYSQIKSFSGCETGASADIYYPSQAVGGLVGAYDGLGVLKLIHSSVNTELTAYRNVGGMVGLASGNTRIDAFMEFIESFNYVEYMLQFYQYLRDSGFLDDLSTVNLQDEKLLAFQQELNEFVGSPINRATIHANHNAGGLVGKSESDLYIANINLVKDRILTSMIQLFFLLQNHSVNSEEEANAAITSLIETTMTEIGTEKRYPIYISLDQDREKLAQPHLANHMEDPVYSAAGGLVGVTGGPQLSVDNPNATPPTLNITNTFTAETIYGDKDVGGFIGVNHSNTTAMLFFTFADLFANKNVGGVIGSDDAQILLLTNAYDDMGDVTIFQNYYLSAVKISANPNVAGDGVIENHGGLIGLASGLNTVVLSNTIQRLVLDVAGANIGGVIGKAEKPASCKKADNCPLLIQNMALDNSEIVISGNENVGGLIGYTNRATVLRMNGVRNATISQKEGSEAETGVGGLVGTASLQDEWPLGIENCYSSALIKGHAAGGILGIGDGDITMAISESLVNVDARGTKYSGAIAGLYDATLIPVTDPNPTAQQKVNILLNNSGFTGIVSIDDPNPAKELYVGGLFGKGSLNAFGIHNVYLYVASNDIDVSDTPSETTKVMNNGAFGGQIIARLAGDNFYYWGAYPHLYGQLSAATDTLPVVGQLLKKKAFSDFDEDGLFIVDSKKEKLTDNDVTFRRLDMSIYGLEGRKCQKVQFTELLRSVKHNIGKQCR